MKIVYNEKLVIILLYSSVDTEQILPTTLGDNNVLILHKILDMGIQHISSCTGLEKELVFMFLFS